MDSPVDAKQCALRLATYFLGLAIICTDYDRVASNPHPLQVHFANLCRLVSTLGLSVLYIESKISSLWCANDEFLFLIWLSAVNGNECKIQLVWLHFSLFFSFSKWLPQNSIFETAQCGHCADWFWLAPCRSRMWRAKFHLVHMATFRRSAKWRRTRWQKAECAALLGRPGSTDCLLDRSYHLQTYTPVAVHTHWILLSSLAWVGKSAEFTGDHLV